MNAGLKNKQNFAPYYAAINNFVLQLTKYYLKLAFDIRDIEITL